MFVIPLYSHLHHVRKNSKNNDITKKTLIGKSSILILVIRSKLFTILQNTIEADFVTRLPIMPRNNRRVPKGREQSYFCILANNLIFVKTFFILSRQHGLHNVYYLLNYCTAVVFIKLASTIYRSSVDPKLLQVANVKRFPVPETGIVSAEALAL